MDTDLLCLCYLALPWKMAVVYLTAITSWFHFVRYTSKNLCFFVCFYINLGILYSLLERYKVQQALKLKTFSYYQWLRWAGLCVSILLEQHLSSHKDWWGLWGAVSAHRKLQILRIWFYVYRKYIQIAWLLISVSYLLAFSIAAFRTALLSLITDLQLLFAHKFHA